MPDALIVQHMGHMGERSRGDSRLRDWPDVEWRLVRQDDDPASARFISAYGRDVDIGESRLVYEPSTRRLTLDGGSRQDARAQEALDAMKGILTDGVVLSGRQIKERLRDSDLGREQIEVALRFGHRTGALAVEPGPHRAKLYRFCAPVSGSVRPVSGNSPSVCPAAYIEPDTRTLDLDASVSGEEAVGYERI